MSLKEPAILIVDDNEDNRYTLTRRLKREGYWNLVEAHDGHEALERLAHTPFDLVLLDIMMPGMNGFETLESMKSDMALRDIPVIMISAVDEVESVVRCIELGAEDHLPKPFNAALLRARISASLEKKRLRDQQESYLRQIEIEKNRVDELLHATLPNAAVHELKSTNTVRPRRFEDVVVLFCDVVGFTQYCDRHAPEEVVSHLQEMVNTCEQITARYGLEKIKTIGDAYMATAGLLHYVENPADASVSAGLEMISAVKNLEASWDLRVGIHIGPVVAGVIGSKQFVFDLWGDTVNVASRIVAESEPSNVLVSAPVWRLIQGRFRGKSMGQVELKGKGALELVQCK
ncbi:adenylate/guanylate cyclase domain-containing protein [Ruegeria lacuscaerulensis]|uniref:adenylate/guanylate cyclase domain-containing protein n=1 Tax=Ruegeria lacuscaerulensis TaxID=55218 RepID=UPI0014813C73|nr:adenylate/guanylate cyclase domain-containing protein [Ruegeria lacuscaerulensis]